MRTGELKGERVIVVEDEASAAAVLKNILEGAGAEVILWQLRNAPIGFIDQRNALVAVLDCQPVSRERRALVRGLRQRGIPFVFYGAEPPGHASAERDALFLAKPCPPEKLIAAMRYVLGKERKIPAPASKASSARKAHVK
jgi:DNA-binding response OmpR family regulator